MYEEQIDGVKKLPDIDNRPKYHINYLSFKDMNLKQCVSATNNNLVKPLKIDPIQNQT